MIDQPELLPGAVQRGFKVAHLNVCSLRNKMPELEILSNKGCYDVITISETWLNAMNETALIALSGYDVFRYDRTLTEGRTRGGGLVTYNM